MKSTTWVRKNTTIIFETVLLKNCENTTWIWKKILLWTMENTTLACNWFATRGSTMIMFYALEITTTVSFELLLFLILPQPT